MCCSVFWCDVVFYSVLQFLAVSCKNVEVCCRVLKCVAVRCRVLQCAAVCSSAL